MYHMTPCIWTQASQTLERLCRCTILALGLVSLALFIKICHPKSVVEACCSLAGPVVDVLLTGYGLGVVTLPTMWDRKTCHRDSTFLGVDLLFLENKISRFLYQIMVPGEMARWVPLYLPTLASPY